MTTQLRQSTPCSDLQAPAPSDRSPRRRIMVRYQSSEPGRAALIHALTLARQRDALLAVVTVATRAPITGCASCRHSAVIWNREMRAIAREDLDEAATLVAGRPDVHFTVVTGEPAKAIADAATRWGTDTVVIPPEPRGRLRRLLSARTGDSLRKLGPWEIVAAPAAPPAGDGGA